jgi:hypothetical protein
MEVTIQLSTYSLTVFIYSYPISQDRVFQTSTSEVPEGQWHEGFEFQISYHAQLFDSIQLDLYDESYILLPDRHIGRAEIRLRHLEGMPTVFTNYYEIWDKKQASSNVSVITQKRNLASNIGAIQCRIYYRYQDANFRSETNSLTQSDKSSTTGTHGDNVQRRRGSSASRHQVAKSAAMLSDQQIGDEFRKHLQSERRTSQGSFHFQKYEEKHDGELKNMNDIDAEADEQQPETDDQQSWFSSWFNSGSTIPSASTSSSSRKEVKEEKARLSSLDSDSNSSLLDTITSWSTSKETGSVLKSISKLLSAFVRRYRQLSCTISRRCSNRICIFQGQGFELSNYQIVTGFAVLEKFYTELPR